MIFTPRDSVRDKHDMTLSPSKYDSSFLFISNDLWTENSFTKTLEYSMSNFSENGIKSPKNKIVYNP